MRRDEYANCFCEEAVGAATVLIDWGKEMGNVELGKSCRNDSVSVHL